ncbi:MAG: hypothetical protein ACOY7L_09015 [Pseudomonadota bacterium]
MARISSAARRSTLRSAIRTRRPSKAGPAEPIAALKGNVTGTGPVGEAEPDPGTVRARVQRKRVKAARAALRAQKQRTGFGRALRTEIRAKRRVSSRRARLRSTVRRRAPD